MEPVAAPQADEFNGGALRAGWTAAVLTQPEGAPAAAAAGSKEATFVKTSCEGHSDPRLARQSALGQHSPKKRG